MKIKASSIILGLLFLFSCSSAGRINTGIDESLIVPGKAAEGFNLGEKIERDIFKVYESRKSSISAILNIDYFSGIKFDSIIYNERVSVLFLEKGTVTAIAGLNIERKTTSDAVLLSKGIDNFILNYGNNGLTIVKSGRHSIYIYKDQGIAVFDDNNDNTIDMYLIFK